MAYLLDANVFIQAKNLHYGMDFCPAFWDWIRRAHNIGLVRSIEKIGDELHGHNDELESWADALPPSFFLEPTATDLLSLAAVSAWVTAQAYEPAAVNTFLQVADYYLVAQAHAGGHTVVTHEQVSPAEKRIKIPNVCIGLGVKVVTTFKMLRTEKVRFVLG